MAVWFDCKKCGEALEAVENKTGILIACPKCQATDRIPGIAMQNQANKEQIERMLTALNRHWQDLGIFFTLLVVKLLFIFVPPLNTMATSSPILEGVGILVLQRHLSL